MQENRSYINKYDVSDDGKIDFEEFKKIFSESNKDSQRGGGEERATNQQSWFFNTNFITINFLYTQMERQQSDFGGMFHATCDKRYGAKLLEIMKEK